MIFPKLYSLYANVMHENRNLAHSYSTSENYVGYRYAMSMYELRIFEKHENILKITQVHTAIIK